MLFQRLKLQIRRHKLIDLHDNFFTNALFKRACKVFDVSLKRWKVQGLCDVKMSLILQKLRQLVSFFTFLRIKHGLAYIEGIIIYKIGWLFNTWDAFKSVIQISVLLEAIIHKQIRVISIMILSCNVIKLLFQVNDRLLCRLMIEYG